MFYWQGLGAAFMLVTATIGAQAAEKNWTVEGEALKISKSCARSVDIQPGGAGHQVTIAASAEKEGEISPLRVTGGSVAALDIDGSCYSAGLFSTRPTLSLSIKVPDGAAIEVKDGGITHYTIGAVGGVLTMSLSGAGGLKAAGAKTLTLELSGAGAAEIGEAGESHLRSSGAGDVTIHHLRGDIEVKSSGAGNLTVDDIEAASVNLRASGHSDIKFGKGSIGNFTLDSAGASNAVVNATVKDAKISVSGAGDVKFAKLTGHLDQSISGIGNVTVVEH
jgi:hypothetical protein